MAQVVTHQQQFAAKQINIVTISFGKPEWAKVWLKETKSPIPLLLDPKRTAYKAFGLQRSVRRSWGWNNLRYYAKAVMNGQKFSLDRGDTNQLGGDFIINEEGVVTFAHPSRDPTDRPDIADLLAGNHYLT